MDYTISEKEDGISVLLMMRRLQISRATLKHLKFMDNGITVNGSHVTVRAVLKKGDVLSLAIEDSISPEKLTPCDLNLPIAYEDTDLVVPNKPANMPTHQSFGHYEDTVANALSFRYSSQGIPFVFRPVNRLDKDTSGLLLIARNRISAAFLSDAMRNGKIMKKYVAILDGVLSDDGGLIDTYLCRSQESIIVRRVCDESDGGDRAITEYSVICRSKTHTMVVATPITGRTHQLRVHFAHLGCPLVGDELYGKKSSLISRHALHSFFLSFPLPSGDNEALTVTAPLHDDMLSLAKAAFGKSLYDSDSEMLKYILP